MAQQEMWKGQIQLKIQAPVEKVWKIVSDFSSLAKWMSGIDTCRIIEGENPCLGCVRYVSGSAVKREDGSAVSWSTEKLLEWDAEKCSMSYSVEDGNLGLSGYKATINLSNASAGSTIVTWSFQMDPLLGCSKTTFLQSFTALLANAIKDLEAAASK